MLQFQCPNEHKIRCPDGQAGRGAKCPKCGVTFMVPDFDVAGEKDGTPPAELVKAEAMPEPSPPPAALGPKKPKEPQIEFLCPNGHRLHGPPSLQGKPGQCPECGSKFRIPSYDEDLSAEEGLEQDLSVGRADGEGSDVDMADEIEGEDQGEPTYQLDFDQEGHEEQGIEPQASESKRHPMAKLFPALWSHKGSGVVVEVLLTSGDSLMPESFAPDASGQYALFSVRTSNGAYTVTAVAWRDVFQVQVRGLKHLPGDLFRSG